MKPRSYHIAEPVARTTSIVFASPHSGHEYPAEFLRRSVLGTQQIRSSEDAYVDWLFDKAPSLGAPLLRAMVPRAFVDLNRSADELDPSLIDGVRRMTHNPRVASGLGVIPRVVANGQAIYRGKLRLSEAHRRIADFWRPYHDALQTLLDQSHNQFGEAILIDCHSMPHEALETVRAPSGRRPEIVLGDRFGAAASSDVVERIEAAFREAGLQVARNVPFAGAYMAQHYGRPSQRQHVVQVEIDRSLYMNERTIRPNSGFEEFRQLMTGIISDLVQVGQNDLPLAAE